MKTAVCTAACSAAFAAPLLAILSPASVALARRDGPWIDQPLEG